MTTDRDRDAAAQFLLATGKEQTATSIETLAELLASVRAEGFGEGYDAGQHDAGATAAPRRRVRPLPRAVRAG